VCCVNAVAAAGQKRGTGADPQSLILKQNLLRFGQPENRADYAMQLAKAKQIKLEVRLWYLCMLSHFRVIAEWFRSDF